MLVAVALVFLVWNVQTIVDHVLLTIVNQDDPICLFTHIIMGNSVFRQPIMDSQWQVL